MIRWFASACVVLSLAATSAGADAARETGGRTVVLDTSSFWRLYHSLAPPVIRLSNRIKPVLLRKWLDRPTPRAPREWAAVGFNDSTWLRGPGRIVCRTPYLAQVCVRGYFDVADPAGARDLRLSVGYHGGILVRVNGVEVARAYLPAGPIDAKTFAEPYPREAFVNAAGKLLIDWDLSKSKPTPERKRRLDLRERRIENVRIPAQHLRRGCNVLALEIIRAAYDEAVEKLKDSKPGRKGCVYNLAFNTCELMNVQLTAAAADGVPSQASRPERWQVFNSDVMAADFDLDYRGPAEPVYPIRIVGARNGIYSGKVVVGCDQPIEGLRAAVGELSSAAATIPAAAIRVRYGIGWGGEDGVYGRQYTYWDNNFSRYPRRPKRIAALDETPPATVEPVAPVWVTVDVPPDAAPGTYAGMLTITAKGREDLNVPIELEVVDWTLPEPGDYRTWVELLQAPDTTALEYGVELWSEPHWAMIERSFKLISETSSRVVYLPLIAHTNLGHGQSMVRWIDKGDGTYEYDFAVLDRYLDTAIGAMGRPKLVVLYVWDIYQMQPEKIRPSSSHDEERRSLRHLRGLTAEIGAGPVVTVVDAATGEVRNVTLPNFDDPKARGLWQGLFDQLLGRLTERGLGDVLTLGALSDAWPNPVEARLFAEMTDGLPWMSYSHMGVPKWRLYDIADVCYQGTVTQNRFANNDPPLGSHAGWRRDRLMVEYARGDNYRSCPPSRLRHTGEFNITGGQRGAGRIGADFWSAVKDKRGRRRGTAAQRYPQSSWRNLDVHSSLLAPGTDGPVSTARFEAFREGLQECEARITIEAALAEPAAKARLGAELVKRCEGLLVERTHYMIKSLGQLRLTGPQHWYVTVGYTYWHRSPGPVGHQWFLGSGWQQRSEKLYRLAGTVARAVGGK